MKLDILAFGAHPDDVELGCSGTIAKEISLGKKVGIIDLTRGELGTRGTAQTRDEEATDAAKILGVSVRENLNFRDGFFVNDEAHQLEIIKMIRKYQPEIVLCNAIADRHIRNFLKTCKKFIIFINKDEVSEKFSLKLIKSQTEKLKNPAVFINEL